MKELKVMVAKKTGVPTSEQRLIFGGKQLEDSKTLANYPLLEHNATVFLILRLLGGANQISLEERHTPMDPGLKYSVDDPCMICFTHPNDEDQTYTARRLPLVMPCPGGHTIMHPHCFMQYCQNEIFDNRKEAVCCPQCQNEWSLDVIEKYGVATKEEIEIFSNALSVNVIHNDPDVIECPGCLSYCERQNKDDIRMYCRICAKQGKNSEFCWHCKLNWKTRGTKECGNINCKAVDILAQIKAAPLKRVVGVLCPSIRLCPSCGTAIQHARACKHLICTTCQCEFCFICLRPARDGSWQCGRYNTKCVPAPRQEKVPTRKMVT